MKSTTVFALILLIVSCSKPPSREKILLDTRELILPKVENYKDYKYQGHYSTDMDSITISVVRVYLQNNDSIDIELRHRFENNNWVLSEWKRKKYTQLLNTLRVKEIQLNDLRLHSTIEEAISQFGKPDSISEKLNEFTDKTYFNYHYGSNHISIEDSSFSNFHIKSNQFVLLDSFSVSTHINELKKKFPLSYKHMITNGDKTLRVKIHNFDSYIIFYIESERVKEFLLWTEY